MRRSRRSRRSTRLLPKSAQYRWPSGPITTPYGLLMSAVSAAAPSAAVPAMPVPAIVRMRRDTCARSPDAINRPPLAHKKSRRVSPITSCTLSPLRSARCESGDGRDYTETRPSSRLFDLSSCPVADSAISAAGKNKTPSSGNLTPSVAGDLLIGAGTHDATTLTTSGSGFTMVAIATENNTTYQPLAMEYRILADTAAAAATFNLGVSTTWAQTGCCSSVSASRSHSAAYGSDADSVIFH